jgi:hypothetical protein
VSVLDARGQAAVASLLVVEGEVVVEVDILGGLDDLW